MKPCPTCVLLGGAAALFGGLGPQPVAAMSEITCGPSYVVAHGDSLSGISLRAYGTLNYHFIYEQNRARIGRNPNHIRVGQVLSIPCRDGHGTAVAEAPVTVTVAEPQVVLASVDVETPMAYGPVELTFNKAAAPGFIINAGIIDNYFEDIARVTEGRVTFTDPDVVDTDPGAQWDLVMSGAVDGAYVLNDKLRASHPLLTLPMLPLMGGSAEQTAVSLWHLHEDYLDGTGYFEEAQLMGFISAPAAHIWRDTSVPIRADEGVLDKNVYPIPYFNQLDVLGPVMLKEKVADWLDAYGAQNSTPPTFFMAHGAARAVGIWTDEMTVTEVDYGVYTPTFSVILSNDAWARISPEDQAAIREVSGEYLAHRSASWDAFDNGFRSDMLVNGLKFVKADAALLADLAERRDAGVAAWMDAAEAAGVPAAAALASYEAHLKSMDDRLIYK